MKWESLGVFLFGFFSCALIFFVGVSDLEFPASTGFVIFEGSEEAPMDHVGEEDIIVLEDRVILKISGVTLSGYADSGSMVPVLDEGANGIRIVPSSESEVDVGDIVSFRIMEKLVVHRVVEKGEDDEGIWFEVKGDANLVGDGRVRFEDIEYKTIAIIY